MTSTQTIGLLVAVVSLLGCAGAEAPSAPAASTVCRRGDSIELMRDEAGVVRARLSINRRNRAIFEMFDENGKPGVEVDCSANWSSFSLYSGEGRDQYMTRFIVSPGSSELSVHSLQLDLPSLWMVARRNELRMIVTEYDQAGRRYVNHEYSLLPVRGPADDLKPETRESK